MRGPVNFLLSRAFRERGRATLLLGDFSGWGVVRRRRSRAEALSRRRRALGAAEQRFPEFRVDFSEEAAPGDAFAQLTA